MHGYIDRQLDVVSHLSVFPSVAILGPRQCGKSTLAKHILEKIPNSLYLDLERPKDIALLRDPELFFQNNKDKFICLDEIQRVPGLFTNLRGIIDERNKNKQFLFLGSASPSLIKQRSESLAGRIAYLELAPFNLKEVDGGNYKKLWLCGGFPLSFSAKSVEISYKWRLNFIRTFIERDIPQLGFKILSSNLERFLIMTSHAQGQIFNASRLAGSLGVTYHTVKSYVDIFERSYFMRTLYPYYKNIKKRIIKSPKIYIRDTGLLHTLLSIETFNDLLGHPIFGASWETFVIENILINFPEWEPSFYRTEAGAEIDLVLEKGTRKIAIECKASSAPQVGKGFFIALEDLQIKEAWIIAPVEDTYLIKENVRVSSLAYFLANGYQVTNKQSAVGP
jgi:predicted AAA+ superfamily ATPase